MESSENRVKIRIMDAHAGKIEVTTEYNNVEEIHVFKKETSKNPALGDILYKIVYKRYRPGDEQCDDIELHFPTIIGFAPKKSHRCIDIKPQYGARNSTYYDYDDFVDKMPDKNEVLRAARATLFGIADTYIANDCSWEDCPENDNGNTCIIYNNYDGNGYEYKDVYSDPEDTADSKDGDYILMSNADVVRLVEANCRNITWEQWLASTKARSEPEWIAEAVESIVKPVVEADGFGIPAKGPLRELPDWAWQTVSMTEHGLQTWSNDGGHCMENPDAIMYCDPGWLDEMKNMYKKTDEHIQERFESACVYASNLLSDTSLSYEICTMAIGPLGNAIWSECDGPFFSDTIKQDMEDHCRNYGERVKYEVINDNE